MSMEALRLVSTSDFQDSQLFDIVGDCDKYNYYVSLQSIEMKRNDNMETCIFLNASFTIFIASVDDPLIVIKLQKNC